MKPNYKKISNTYPSTETKKELFKLLGNNWDPLVNNEQYDNTCAIRISYAFNLMGIPVPEYLGREDGYHKDSNGKNIMIKVLTAEKFLKSIYGDTNWGMSKKVGSVFEFSEIPNQTGILIYKAEFTNADGHVDVWNGNKCSYHCPALDVSDAFDIGLWYIN
ncbi:MAG: type VI secretion system amidase effector protein Tae4 [Candidatus Thiodiazotropha endolucinida]|nr:type VI secretion system amidase effector protein Tae4 [Candidatus Thiodiazotropha taylori]MCW4318765.1 type VI secretion system amidase effector protein Tae4 [Candidatus Thiodiazotropha taylori]